MTTPPLSALEQRAEKARRAFETAQAAANAASQAAERRRQAALEVHDRDRLAGYDDGALSADVRDAADRLRQAVLDDPVMAAVADLYAARTRHYVRYTEATALAGRFGVAGNINGAGPATPPSFAELLALATDAAAHRVTDEQAARDAERAAAGEAAAQ